MMGNGKSAKKVVARVYFWDWMPTGRVIEPQPDNSLFRARGERPAFRWRHRRWVLEPHGDGWVFRLPREYGYAYVRRMNHDDGQHQHTKGTHGTEQ